MKHLMFTRLCSESHTLYLGSSCSKELCQDVVCFFLSLLITSGRKKTNNTPLQGNK